MKHLIYIFLFSLFFSASGQKNSPVLDQIIKGNSALSTIIAQKDTYKPQIIYTEINRDKNNSPTFTDHYFLVDSSNYFYCASLVKLPTSIIALERIKELQIQGLSKDTYMFTDNVFPCQATCIKDTSSASGFPSLGHYIKKMMLVSDNFSYSRVYEFLGPAYLQNRLNSLGYPNSRIIHRFDPLCKGDANSCMNPVRFLNTQMNVIYKQDADNKQQIKPNPLGTVVLGSDLYNKKGKLVSEKKDFTYSNFLPLTNIHSILKRLIFHGHLNETQRFNISTEDQQFLVKLLGMYPRESDYPRYNPKTYHDSYKKYFMYGNKEKHIGSDSMRVFNIIGYSYGFLVDCAYIVDFKNKIEFMLSAVIYTNKKNSFGSGVYEYEQVGIPYLKDLSLAVYAYDKKRIRSREPDLTEFKLYNSTDTTRPPKVQVKGNVTVNDLPTKATVIVKSVNKVFLYYPETSADSIKGEFTINLLAGEDYELEISIKDSPPQVIEISTKKNKDKDTLHVYVDFMSPHLDKIVKTKQDSLFIHMINIYNKLSLQEFADKHGNTKIDGLCFKVQIGAYKFIENFNYAKVAGMPVIIRETFDDYITRFTMGNYATYNEAAELLQKLKEAGIKDAFIISVHKGKRLYLNELLESGVFK